MNTKPRLIALFMAVALFASIFSGCGSSKDQLQNPVSSSSQEVSQNMQSETSSVSEADIEETGTSPAAAEPEQPDEQVEALPEMAVFYPLSEETVTLSLFFSVSPNLASMLTSMNDIVAYDATEEATNVHLDATISTPETTGEKFQVMIASGEYTDLIHGVSQNYAGGLDKAIGDEVLLDLYPYLNEYAPDYVAFLDENPTAKKLYTTESGYMAAIQGLSYSFVQGPIIREDWLVDLGLEIPETIAELETVLTAFKNEKGANNAVLFTTGNIYLAGSFNVGDGTMDGTDGAVYNVIDGQVEMCYFEDGYYDFIWTLSDWYQKGLYSTDFISLFGAGVANSFVQSDDCGFWYGAQDNLGSDYASTYAGTSDHFNTIPVPLVTRELGQTIDTGTMLGTSGEAWSVTTDCNIPEIAVSYLNWFFTDEGTVICNYGKEGESFVYDEQGVPVYTDLIVSNPDGLSQMQAQWIYCNFQAPYVQDTTRNDSLYADETQRSALSIWDSNRTNDKKYYGSLTAEEAEIYNIYASDLETFAGEQLLKFILNQETLTHESWESFLHMVWYKKSKNIRKHACGNDG